LISKNGKVADRPNLDDVQIFVKVAQCEGSSRTPAAQYGALDDYLLVRKAKLLR
jgi:hypothetical protein